MGFVFKFLVAMALGLGGALAYQYVGIDMSSGGVHIATGETGRAVAWPSFVAGLAGGIALGPLAYGHWAGMAEKVMEWLGSARKMAELAILGAACIAVLVYI